MEAMLFVYFANILPQISSTIGGFIVLGLMTLGFWVIFGGIALDASATNNREKFNSKLYRKPLYIIGVPLVILATIKPLIPDRDTMYLMAGAYVGQQVLTSDIAKDAYEIISLEVNKILQQKKKELQSSVESKTKEVAQ